MARGVNSEELPFDYDCATYGDCQKVCQLFATKCDSYQKEMVVIIIDEILTQWEQMRDEIREGKRSPSIYLLPAELGNRWGNLIVALMEAFDYAEQKKHVSQA